MKTRLLLQKLAKRFPKRYAKMNHDFVGLMTGKLPEEVNNILLCLDFDQEVLPLIEENKPDLILTHHPFIYGTRAKVLKYDKLKEELCHEIDELGVPVYSMHTNFDTGKETGFAVILFLSTKYDYPNDLLDDWKKRLKAKDYVIIVKRNQLRVKFNVMY